LRLTSHLLNEYDDDDGMRVSCDVLVELFVIACCTRSTEVSASADLHPYVIDLRIDNRLQV